MVHSARFAVGMLGFALLFPVAGEIRVMEKSVRVQEIAVFRTGILPKPFYASQARAFDLSPDGQTLAILLETHPKFDDAGSSIWLVFWDVETGQIKRSTRLEGPDPETRNHAQYRFKIRYAPKIRRIFVLTGPRLVSLDAESLEMTFVFESPALPGKALESRLIKHFSVAENGSRLAVEYWEGYPRREVEIVIVDATEGRIMSRWNLASPGWVALSPAGERIVLGRDAFGPGGFLSNKPNVFVCDSITGTVQTSFATGHPTVQTDFFTADQLIVHSRDGIRIWDFDDRIVREFDYGKYGVFGEIGSMGISTKGNLLAAVVQWSSPWNLRLDTDIFPAWRRVVLWDLSSNKRIYVSPNGPTGPGVTHWEVVRMSADGSRLAVGEENSFASEIWIYSVARP